MSILSKSPLDNDKLMIGAKNQDGTSVAGFEQAIWTIDWYKLNPEDYFKKYLPDNIINYPLENPTQNTYFLLYITDTYESIHGDNAAQRIMSVQRWNMVKNNNYLPLSLVYGTNTSNKDRTPEQALMDNGTKHDDSYYPDSKFNMWATTRENGSEFGMANWEQRDKMGDRPGDPENSPAFIIAKYNGTLSLLNRYDLRIEWETSPRTGIGGNRKGRVPTCWKVYQSTNTSTPEWKLLDAHFLDDMLYTQGHSSKNFEFTCNYGN